VTGYGKADPNEERDLKVLDHLYESNCTMWDTADAYGESEDIIGKWFKRTGNRDKVFIVTKFGFTETFGIDGSPEHVKVASERSLKRLGVDVIDLYFLHRTDKTVPIEETVIAMRDLVKAGKVRYIGLSEPSPETLRRAHKIHPITAIQVEYSPFTLTIEEKGHLLDTARELGVKILAYSPLGRGILTGQIKSHEDIPDEDFRKSIPKFSVENFPKILKLVGKLESVATKYNATSGQIALAWLLAQGDDIIPIPGTKTIKYLDENLGALKINLDDGDKLAIREACENAEIHGGTYPEQFQNFLFTDTPAWEGQRALSPL